ncbi:MULTISPECIES: acyltransferase family protein [unclassified Microbacterium]|uniref:acyltransferase family protein n=1 Tax=unclassified Microbacterium TaxID=2609290 RepID=UPI000B34D64A|nr:acyltransferase family protein [Microbacterium sp. JB110]
MDTLRGLSILLVILHHSTQIVTAPFADDPNPPAVLEPFIFLSEFFAPFRMPMLMFLSGLLISGSLKRTAGQYVWGKLRRILWPIIVWTAVFNLALIAGGGSLPGMPWEWAFWNTYLWFMQFVLVYYLVALLTKWVPAWAFILLGFVGMFLLPDDTLIQRLFYLMPFFFLGAFIERFWDRFVAAINVPVAIALTAIPLALGLASAFWVPLWYEPFAAVPGLLGILALARVAVYIPDAGWLRPVRFVGQYSLIFYVVHYPAYAAIFNIAERVGVTHPAVVLPVVFLVTLAVSTGFALIGRRLPFSLLFELPRRMWPKRAAA